MARLGAAVTIVTTGTLDDPVGFTASAVCSVTDDPPTILVCLKRGSRARETFQVGSPLCVNILTPSQQPLSDRFAGPLDAAERFAAGHWSTLETGAPVLTDAVASLDCQVSEIVEVGTHSVLFGLVKAVRIGSPSGALVYFNRAYHHLPHGHAATS